MPTFGFSAFLKLISLNSRPRRTLIRRRTAGSKQGGYDFHRSLRLLANRYIVGGAALQEVLRLAGEITQPSERSSAQSGLERLAEWRSNNPGSILNFEPVVFESPAKNFKVQFQPDFGVQLGEQKIATHIWNTRTTVLDKRMMYAALSLILPLYSSKENSPSHVGVLSLPDQELYRLGEVGEYAEVGSRLVRMLDDIFEEISRESESPGKPSGDQPSIPPPTR